MLGHASPPGGSGAGGFIVPARARDSTNLEDRDFLAQGHGSWMGKLLQTAASVFLAVLVGVWAITIQLPEGAVSSFNPSL